MKIGDIIENIHTAKTYTVIGIDIIKNSGEEIVVYEVANDNFESLRFNASYIKHYKIINSMGDENEDR